jgi:hypothetical protein
MEWHCAVRNPVVKGVHYPFVPSSSTAAVALPLLLLTNGRVDFDGG